MARLDVRTVRKMMEEGKTVAEIAQKYGVTVQAVYKRLKEDDARKESRMGMGYGRKAVTALDNRHTLIDPETGLVVQNTGAAAVAMGKMGDERVTAFVKYHLEMLGMRQGVDKSDVDDLYRRFIAYLGYCAEHGIIPNNMNCYFALGVSRQDVSAWRHGVQGTPRHREFADMITDFFASVHEQSATDGIVNPIYAMWLQKAHDRMIEAQKLEVTTEDPLGEKRSAEDIARAYSDVELPD